MNQDNFYWLFALWCDLCEMYEAKIKSINMDFFSFEYFGYFFLYEFFCVCVFNPLATYFLLTRSDHLHLVQHLVIVPTNVRRGESKCGRANGICERYTVTIATVQRSDHWQMRRGCIGMGRTLFFTFRWIHRHIDTHTYTHTRIIIASICEAFFLPVSFNRIAHTKLIRSKPHYIKYMKYNNLECMRLVFICRLVCVFLFVCVCSG